MGPVPLAAAAFGASVLAVLLGAVNVGLLQLVPLDGAAGQQSGPPPAAPPEVLSLLAVGIHPVFSALATPAIMSKHLATLRVVRLAAFVAVGPWTACLGLTLLRDISRLRGRMCSRIVSTAEAGCEGGGGAFRSGCVPSSRPCALATAATAFAAFSLLAAAISIWLVVQSASRAAATKDRDAEGSDPPGTAIPSVARNAQAGALPGVKRGAGPVDGMPHSRGGAASHWLSGGGGGDSGHAEASWGTFVGDSPLPATALHGGEPEDEGEDADAEGTDGDDEELGLLAAGHGAELRTLLPGSRG